MDKEKNIVVNLATENTESLVHDDTSEKEAKRQEVLGKIKNRKYKKARKVQFLRWFKNFFIWILGVLFGLVLPILVIALVPVGPIIRLTGNDPSAIVSEKIQNKSIPGIVMGYQDLTLSDIPVLTGAISGAIPFPGFTEHVKAPEDVASSNVDKSVLYYKTDEETFEKAFKEDGTFADGVDETAELYFAKLSELPLTQFASTFIAEATSVKAVDLLSMVGVEVEEGGAIANLLGDKTVSDLMNIDFESINISIILPGPTADNPDQNKALYDLIIQAANIQDENGNGDIYDDVTLGAFSSFDIANVKLTAVIAGPTAENPDQNKKLYDLLLEATGAEDYDHITLDSLSSFDFSNVKLTSVMAGPTAENPDQNKQLYDLLLQATGAVTYDDIKISSLNSFDISGVKLNTVIASSSNKILNSLLSDETVTIGNMGEKVDALQMNSIFPIECFVQNDGLTSGYYVKVGNDYILDTYYTSGTTDGHKYQISNSASVWILMYYDFEGGIDSNGNVNKFADSNLTFANMETCVSDIGSRVEGATIRFLCDAGIISDPEYTGPTAGMLYARTLATALNPVD